MDTEGGRLTKIVSDIIFMQLFESVTWYVISFKPNAAKAGSKILLVTPGPV